MSKELLDVRWGYPVAPEVCFLPGRTERSEDFAMRLNWGCSPSSVQRVIEMWKTLDTKQCSKPSTQQSTEEN